VRRAPPPAPPAVVRALLAHLLPRGVRGEAVRGDLDEEFAARARTSPSEARAWYRRQGIRVLVGYRLGALFSGPRLSHPAEGIHLVRGGGPSSLAQDFRYAGRRLLRAPFFTVIATITIAMGIGTSASIFSVLDAVLLQPLPYFEPDRLVQIWETNSERVAQRGLAYSEFGVNALNYLDYESSATSFEELGWTAPYADVGTATVGGGTDGAPERVGAMSVSPSFFTVFGTAPVLGRNFLPEEVAPPGEMRWTEVVILSNDLWVRRFGSDPGIVGRQILVDAGPSTVVGVLPADFEFPSLTFRGAVAPRDVDVYVPLFYPAFSQPRAYRQLMVVGRLAKGVDASVAQADVTRIAARLAEEHPGSMAGWTAVVMPLDDLLLRDFAPSLGLLMVMVGFLLVVACTNVANLMIARGASRRAELTIRAAVGGGRIRLARLLMVESLLLACWGGALGVLLAHRGTQALLRLVPTSIPRAHEVTVDARVLAFAVAITALAGILFGLAPALRFSAPAFHGASRRLGGDEWHPGRRRGPRVLAASQVALTSVLLIAGAILVRSFLVLRSVDRGYDATYVLTASIDRGAHHRYARLSFDDEEGRQARWRDTYEMMERLRAIPGVTAVASGGVRLDDLGVWPIQFRGYPGQPPPEELINAALEHVSPEYFETLRIPIVRGEGLLPWDGVNDWQRYWWAGGCEADGHAYCRAVVSETFAATAWPGEDPIGKQVGVYGCCWTVSGVAADVNFRGVDAPPLAARMDARMRVYVPYTELGPFLIRTVVDPLTIVDEVRAAIMSVDADGAVHVSTLERTVSDSLARPRFYSVVVTFFGGVALVLALVGLYGVVGYTVSRRTREIGIRMAVGAQRHEVTKMVLTEGMIPVGVGAALGALTSVAFAGALEGLLYGLDPVDVRVILAVVGSVALVFALACLLPARRASALDPTQALALE
jgi:putative ABC transport system permease protein